MPESAYGPTNNCIGIGDILRRRGHRVVFAAEASWKGKLEALGFEEDLVDLAPPAERGAGRGPVLEGLHPRHRPGVPQDHLGAARDGHQADLGRAHRRRRSTASRSSRRSSSGFGRTSSSRTTSSPSRRCSPRASRSSASCPATRWRCAARTSRRSSPACPPTTARSGPPSAPSTTAPTARSGPPSTRGSCEQGAPPLPDLDFIHEGDLNLYVYPGDRRLHRRPAARPPPGTAWTPRCARPTRTSSCPGVAGRRDGALVYFSLGSLGSADVELMQRVIDVLGTTPHRYIVSKGPLHEEIELADNMWGAEFLPQTKIIPQVRPGHHARRQQHHHRGAALRQADDPAAAVLGPVRQRPAGARAGLRRAAGHLRLHRRGADRRARPAARRHRAPRAPGRRRRGDPPPRRPAQGRRPDRGPAPEGLRRPTTGTRPCAS